MKYLVLYLCFLVFYLSGFSQGTSDESLIVVHYDAEGKEEFKQSIYRYNFVNNLYTEKEKIISVTGIKNGKDYIRFDKGDNTIYKDRYLISGIGNIIDLKDKKILYEGPAKLIRCSNDSVVFFISNSSSQGKHYSYFDLKTNTYSEIKDPAFTAVVGQDIELDRSSLPYKLFYTPENKSKVLLMDDAGQGNVSVASNKSEIPFYWIDNNTFLFPYIKTPDLEGNIIKYTLSDKTAKVIGTFNSAAKMPATYKWIKGNNSFVEFYFKDKLYMINPTKETMLISSYKEVDSNYALEVEAKAKGRAIYYKGKEIGKNHFELNTFKVGTNYAGFLKEIVMGDESYQLGLTVYIVSTKSWQNITSTDVASVVGWIKK